jgi:hypothetical protein
MKPRARELWAIALTAVAFRVAVFLSVTLWFDVSLERYVAKGDTSSYLAAAREFLGDTGAMTEYDRRVFPGYPGLIAAAGSFGVPLPWAALGITWLSTGVAAAVAAAVFADRRVGWAMVMLIPHYAINSSMGMTEAPLLALSLGGILVARGPVVDVASGARAALSGLLFGVAWVVRPVACFAALGAMTADFIRGPRARGVLIGVVTGVVAIAAVIALHSWNGDALRGVRVYANNRGAYGGDRMFVWPFKSLIFTPLYDPQVSIGRVVYIWAHVMVTLGAVVILVRRCLRQPKEALDVLALVWLAGNTLFVLCIGSYWGFQHFPRFTIPAMPALFWAWRGVLPDRWYLWAPIAAGVFVMAVLGVHASP